MVSVLRNSSEGILSMVTVSCVIITCQQLKDDLNTHLDGRSKDTHVGLSSLIMRLERYSIFAKSRMMLLRLLSESANLNILQVVKVSRSKSTILTMGLLHLKNFKVIVNKKSRSLILVELELNTKMAWPNSALRLLHTEPVPT